MPVMDTYRVIAPSGIVVVDGGTSLSYKTGAIFPADVNNASVQRHLAMKNIVPAGTAMVEQNSESAEVRHIHISRVGPTGPRGEKGEPGNDGKDGLDGKDGEDGADGADGKVGPQGPRGARGINWRGMWSPVIDYEVDDGVTHNGSSFIATKPSFGNPPPSTSWMLLAAQGLVGPQGPPGAGRSGITEQEVASERWLYYKACLDALPPPPNDQLDPAWPGPYATMRKRLTVEMQKALEDVERLGGFA